MKGREQGAEEEGRWARFAGSLAGPLATALLAALRAGAGSADPV